MRRSEAGVTLIEVVIGLALLSSALLVANLSFASIAKLQQRGLSGRAVQQGGRYILETLGRDIRNAELVVRPNETSLDLTNNFNSRVVNCYRLSNGQIMRGDLVNGACENQRSISSDNVRVEGVKYELTGPQGRQDSVRISLVVRDRSLLTQESDSFYKSYQLNTSVGLRIR